MQEKNFQHSLEIVFILLVKLLEISYRFSLFLLYQIFGQILKLDSSEQISYSFLLVLDLLISKFENLVALILFYYLIEFIMLPCWMPCMIQE